MSSLSAQEVININSLVAFSTYDNDFLHQGGVNNTSLLIHIYMSSLSAQEVVNSNSLVSLDVIEEFSLRLQHKYVCIDCHSNGRFLRGQFLNHDHF